MTIKTTKRNELYHFSTLIVHKSEILRCAQNDKEVKCHSEGALATEESKCTIK